MRKKIKKTKHNNRKSGGYDSQIEVVRHKELLLLEMAGEIKDIVLHPKFILQDGFRYKNERKSVSIKYEFNSGSNATGTKAMSTWPNFNF